MWRSPPLTRRIGNFRLGNQILGYHRKLATFMSHAFLPEMLSIMAIGEHSMRPRNTKLPDADCQPFPDPYRNIDPGEMDLCQRAPRNETKRIVAARSFGVC